MTGKVTTLHEVYIRLAVHASRIYITPDIPRFSRHNPYLENLYRPITAEPNAPQLISSGFWSPKWLFRRMMGEISIYHHHWFECNDLRSLLNCLWKIFWTVLYRLAGGKIIWTIHNRRPHHGKWKRANHLLRKTWSRIPNVFHLHCVSAIVIMQQELGINPKKCVIIPHPPFRAKSVSRGHADNTIEKLFPQVKRDGKPLILIFGYVAAYKGIVETIRAFLASGCDGQLLIAGQIKNHDQTLVQELYQLCKGSQKIHLAPQFIKEDQLAGLLQIVDYTVFNYSDILTSGGVHLAAEYQAIIIAPAIGCLKELPPPALLFESREELQEIFTRVGLQ